MRNISDSPANPDRARTVMVPLWAFFILDLLAILLLTHFVSAMRLSKDQRLESPTPHRGVAAVPYGPVAHGIVAVGGRATGVIALWGIAAGFIAFGGLTLGVISIGRFSIGVFSVAAVALGLEGDRRTFRRDVAFGGLALGPYACAGDGVASWRASSREAGKRNISSMISISARRFRFREALRRVLTSSSSSGYLFPGGELSCSRHARDRTWIYLVPRILPSVEIAAFSLSLIAVCQGEPTQHFNRWPEFGDSITGHSRRADPSYGNRACRRGYPGSPCGSSTPRSPLCRTFGRRRHNRRYRHRLQLHRSGARGGYALRYTSMRVTFPDSPRSRSARRDAERLGLPLASIRNRICSTPFCRSSSDLIVSGPPYVGRREAHSLPREVHDHEPESALYGGGEGCEVYGALRRPSTSFLKSGGFSFSSWPRSLTAIATTFGNYRIDPTLAFAHDPDRRSPHVLSAEGSYASREGRSLSHADWLDSALSTISSRNATVRCTRPSCAWIWTRFSFLCELLTRPEFAANPSSSAAGLINTASFCRQLRSSRIRRHSAMPLRTTRRLSPALFFSTAITEDTVVERDRVASILTPVLAIVGMVSIDEAYLDLAGTSVFTARVATAGQASPHRDRRDTASVLRWLGNPRLVAKVASDRGSHAV